MHEHLWTRPRPQPAARLRGGGRDAAASPRRPARLYLTQPAVSAALRRLTAAVGAPLFAAQGRGLALTSRGERLRAEAAAAPRALVEAALAPARRSTRRPATARCGSASSDAAEVWLLPPLLRVLEREAPRMRVVAIPVQFRTVGAALAAGASTPRSPSPTSCPPTIRRRAAVPRRLRRASTIRAHARLRRRSTEAEYFAHDHVIVSYNGDLRGIVEDMLGKHAPRPLLGLELRQPRRARRRHARCSRRSPSWSRCRSSPPART